MEIICKSCGNLQECNPRRIKDLRKKLNISQSKLAKMTGIPQQTISRIENNIGEPSFSNVAKIINFLFIEKEKKNRRIKKKKFEKVMD